MNKITIGIVCELQAEYIKESQNTWIQDAQKLDIPVVVLTAKKELTKEITYTKFINCDITDVSAYQKIIYLCKYLYHSQPSDFYLLAIPNIYIWCQHLLNILYLYNSNNKISISYHGSGLRSGIILTRSAMESIYNIAPTILNIKYELTSVTNNNNMTDKLFSELCSNLGIQSVSQFGFYSCDWSGSSNGSACCSGRINYNTMISFNGRTDQLQEFHSKRHTLVSSDLLIYVLYFNDDSLQRVINDFSKFSWAYFLKITTTKYFENFAFNHISNNKHEWQDKKFVGFISNRYFDKVRTDPTTILNNISNYNTFDLITLMNTTHTVYLTGNKWHPLLSKITEIILKKMGINIANMYDPRIPAFYCNYWLAKPEWMEKYMNFYFKVYNIMEDKNDKQLQNLLHQNSQFGGKVSKDILLNIGGKPYYTYHSFILERLPCIFFWMNKAKICRI